MSNDVNDELISAYLDGELPPRQQVPVAAKLTATEANRAAEAELTAVKQLLRERLQPVAEPEGFWNGVHSRLVAEGRNLPPRRASWLPQRRRWLVPALAGAALAALLLVTQAVRPRTGRLTTGPGVAPVAGTVPVASLIEAHVHHASQPCIPARDFADPARASVWLQQQVGFVPTPPALEQAGLALTKAGPCVCLTHARGDAAALYTCRTADRRRVGVYQLRPRALQWEGGVDKLLGERTWRVTHRGPVSAVAWEYDCCLYGVTGDLGENDLLDVSQRLCSGQQCPPER